MRENWGAALNSILESEGFHDGKRGWSNDPLDNGGPTLAGITYGNLCEWRHYAMPKVKGSWDQQIVAELYNLSDEMIGQFYYERKWIPISGDDLPSGIDIAVADVCVLHGPSKAREFLRKALGFLPAGKIDDEVVAAAVGHGDYHAIIKSIADQRRAHYDAIIKNAPKQVKWRKGWYNRTARVEAQCYALALDQAERSGMPPPLLTDVARADVQLPPMVATLAEAAATKTVYESNTNRGASASGVGGGFVAIEQVKVGITNARHGGGFDWFVLADATVFNYLFWTGFIIIAGSLLVFRERWLKGDLSWSKKSTTGAAVAEEVEA